MPSTDSTPPITTPAAPAGNTPSSASSSMDGAAFMDGAKNFIKNPLGIIGLFIVLVYSVATIVIGVYLVQKGCEWQQPFTWFIVLFPLVVLFVFRDLVINHHLKLYAPSEIPDIKPIVEAYANLRTAIALSTNVPAARDVSQHTALQGAVQEAANRLAQALNSWPRH